MSKYSQYFVMKIHLLRYHIYIFGVKICILTLNIEVHEKGTCNKRTHTVSVMYKCLDTFIISTNHRFLRYLFYPWSTRTRPSKYKDCEQHVEAWEYHETYKTVLMNTWNIHVTHYHHCIYCCPH